MQRLRALSWLFVASLTLGLLAPDADAAQRGRGSTGAARGSTSGARPAPSPPAPSPPAPSVAPQRTSSRPSVRPSRTVSRPTVGRTSSTPSRRSVSRPSTTGRYDQPSRSSRTTTTGSSEPRIIRVTPTPSSSGSGYVVPPSAEREPAPGSSRVDAAVLSSSGPSPSGRVDALPANGERAVDESSAAPVYRRAERVPVPLPYRGAGAVDRTAPATRRAVDRYRDAVETGEWARLRQKLDGGSPLRMSTSRNLDRLVERYADAPGARDAEGGRLDERYSSREFRYAYDRGPLDRLARPNARTAVQSAPAVNSASAVGRARATAGPRLADFRSPLVAAETDPLGRFARERAPSEPVLERDAPARRALRGMADLAERDPAAARQLAAAGTSLARVTRASLAAASTSIAGATAGAAADAAASGSEPPGYNDCPDYYWDDGWYFNFGVSFYWGAFGYGPYAYLGYGGYCTPWGSWWNHPYWWYPHCSPSYGFYGHPYGYSWCPPVYYSSAIYSGGYYGGVHSQPVVIVEQQEVPPTVVIVEQPAAAEPAPSQAPAAGGDAGGDAGGGGVPRVSSAADSYLTLGDRAFREERYADAAHFYAKATELEPNVAVFYLVLSDALFATGDYGYAAFAIRTALELEPELVESSIDKRTFYSDPLAFDRQLAVLELYTEDHPADADARLVLAANLLFSGAPARAVDLLQDDLSAGLADDQAAGVLLARAQEAQFGE